MRNNFDYFFIYLSITTFNASDDRSSFMAFDCDNHQDAEFAHQHSYCTVVEVVLLLAHCAI